MEEMEEMAGRRSLDGRTGWDGTDLESAREGLPATLGHRPKVGHL